MDFGNVTVKGTLTLKNGETITNTVDGTVAISGILGTENIYPATDNTHYIGKNDDDTPLAFKGIILKDTTNGKYYRIEIINGTITPTDLTD